MFVEGLRGFATLAGGKTKFGTVFGAGPVEYGVPEGRADTLTANAFVGDEILEIGGFSDDWSHDDGEGGDADDAALVIDSE